MRAKGCQQEVNNRIHAIILTQDRPETLRRCVTTALASLGQMDILTIIDDSTPELCSVNAHLLATMFSSSQPRGIHLPTSRIRNAVGQVASEPSLLWLDKTAPRDIAPHRNTSLLLSEALPARTTILIDDDIHGFDLAATHERTNALIGSYLGFIGGAEIGGLTELDIIRRLSDAIDKATTVPGLNISSYRELFQVQKGHPPILGNPRKYVSAGYLAFRLPETALFAFPPGYNEDWLWCLLHGRTSEVQIVSLGEVVTHDPPALRQLSRADLLFELIGDVVFDCFEEQTFPECIDPETVLACVSNYCPQADSMPSTRAVEVMDKARFAKLNGLLPILQEYGLGDLATMLDKGELEMSGTRLMNDWGTDAIAKQRSLASTLRDRNVMAAISSLCQEGTLY